MPTSSAVLSGVSLIVGAAGLALLLAVLVTPTDPAPVRDCRGCQRRARRVSSDA